MLTLVSVLKGVIMDSVTFSKGSPSGTAKSKTDNRFKKLEKFMFDNPQKIPALFLFSRDDPISDPAAAFKLAKHWKENGVPVRVKCWDKSAHVLHYKLHQKDYEKEIDEF